MWTRRQALGAMAASAASLAFRGQDATRSKMTVGDFSYVARRRLDRDRPDGGLNDPIAFLEHVRALGAGGIQAPLGVRDAAYAAKLRALAEQDGLLVQGSIGLPWRSEDLDRFEAQVRTAKACGDGVLRTVCLGGRRYESFDSLRAWEDFAARSLEALRRAEPVLARHKVRMAFENHKDWRVPEMIPLLKKLSSEWIGAWVDFGNNHALLEDDHDVVDALAPWAFAAHVKDMAAAEYADGILVADVALGKGAHDLPRMIAALRKANPKIEFCLEAAVRDPLKVPCFTPRYWATLPDVPGSDLARALRRARLPLREPLPQVDALPLEERARLEDARVKASVDHARTRLGV
jgi:sugar phosphate isomerase/epimerase